MFRPLCGGPADIPGVPASEPPRPGVAAVAAGGCCSPPAATTTPPRTRTSPPAPTGSRSTAPSFPTEQRLGQTSLLRLGVRNTGEKTVPALTVTISIAGEEGEDLLPALRDPRPAAGARPARPAGLGARGRRYPKLAGSSEPGGAATSNPKTFAFGPLKPGETVEAVWKLSAVRAGSYTLLYGSTPASAARPRRRRPAASPRRLLRRRDHSRHRRTPKSPTAAKWSKIDESQAASRRVACRACGACAARSRPRRSPCRPARCRACGSAGRALTAERARGSAGRRRRPEADRPLRRARSTSPARPGSRSCSSWSSSRAGSWSCAAAAAAAAVPRHPRPGRLRRRAGPALDRLPARLRAEPALLRLLHGQRRATSASTSSSAAARPAPRRARAAR